MLFKTLRLFQPTGFSFLPYSSHILHHMKKISITFVALIFWAGIFSYPANAQSRFNSPNIKNIDDARSRAIKNTIFPLAVGIGAATLFESKTIETTGSILAVYGLIMGPSTGNFYAKDYLRGMLGVAARIGGGFLIKDATREIMGGDVADALGWDDEDVRLTDTNILIGGGLILGSAIYNVISSKASVNRFNEKTGAIIAVVPGFQQGQTFPMLTASFDF
jgi:hypothetical protein